MILSPSHRSHHERFCQVLEEQLEIYNVEEQLNRIQQNPTHNDIKTINELIIRIFKVVRKKVEGVRRKVPYSRKKVKQMMST